MRQIMRPVGDYQRDLIGSMVLSSGHTGLERQRKVRARPVAPLGAC
jgi:hypothetical protein